MCPILREGGSLKIWLKLNFKIGSFDKISHKAQGGDFKIQTQKIKIEAKSKIGSLDKITHKAGGGNVKIHNQRLRYITFIYNYIILINYLV